MADEKKWRFCVAGNIVKNHTDDEGNIWYGTKAFRGGAKVYLCGKYWSWDFKVIRVIGLNRFNRYVAELVSPEYIENARFQTVFKPEVIRIMDYQEEEFLWWGRTAADKRGAKGFADAWNNRKFKLSETDGKENL